MTSNLALLGKVLGGGTSIDVRWRNFVMAPAWSIVLAAAARERANKEEAKEANADGKPTNFWR